MNGCSWRPLDLAPRSRGAAGQPRTSAFGGAFNRWHRSTDLALWPPPLRRSVERSWSGGRVLCVWLGVATARESSVHIFFNLVEGRTLRSAQMGPLCTSIAAERAGSTANNGHSPNQNASVIGGMVLVWGSEGFSACYRRANTLDIFGGKHRVIYLA